MGKMERQATINDSETIAPEVSATWLAMKHGVPIDVCRTLIDATGRDVVYAEAIVVLARKLNIPARKIMDHYLCFFYDTFTNDEAQTLVDAPR